MVSPYLSRPLRSLREALESGEALPRRQADSVEASGARPESANPLAPQRPILTVVGGVAEPL